MKTRHTSAIRRRLCSSTNGGGLAWQLAFKTSQEVSLTVLSEGLVAIVLPENGSDPGHGAILRVLTKWSGKSVKLLCRSMLYWSIGLSNVIHQELVAWLFCSDLARALLIKTKRCEDWSQFF